MLEGFNTFFLQRFREKLSRISKTFLRLPEMLPSNYQNMLGNSERKTSGIPRLVYAHIEIVVAFLVVKIFGFLVIARNPPDGIRRKLVEILPTSLPDLPKTFRTPQNLRKSFFWGTDNFRTNRNNYRLLTFKRKYSPCTQLKRLPRNSRSNIFHTN